MKSVKLPEDVRRFRNRRLIRKGFLCAASLLAMALLLYFAGDRLFSALGKSRVIMEVFLMLLPFYFTKFPWILKDSSWRGEVISSRIATERQAVGGGASRRAGRRLVDVNVLYLTVRKEDGTEMETVAAQFISTKKYASKDLPYGRAVEYENLYLPGDFVYHFYGINRLLVLHPHTNDHVSCLVCGSRNRYSSHSCWECGHTLPKF
jgi:hypothetical protein